MLSPGLFEKKNNLHFRSLITIQISQQSPILTQKKTKKITRKNSHQLQLKGF